MKSPEHRVRCLSPVTYQGGDEQLRFTIDGSERAVSLRIKGLNRGLVAGLTHRALDLLEIAGLVYAIDSAVSRGGSADQALGMKWHRGFNVQVPVREVEFWSQSGLKRELEEMLMFLSGDRFRFSFTERNDPPNESGFFDFGEEDGWQADRVVMFSGGLDSFAGALEEIAEQRQKVALVSHFSAGSIAKVQKSLHRAMAEQFGKDSCRHVPMRAQMVAGSNREATHRTRSFLFAVLGMITARAFGLDRVSFHENGVVSLNLPPVGNVLGTRATRTTHPQTLNRFSRLFSQVFGESLRVDNPFFWRTKTDVMDSIHRLRMQEQIATTTSCADTRNRTKQHPYCGRCSQCIDRRFAVLAADLQGYDPEEAYAVDLMKGSRTEIWDKEIVLSYMRNAAGYEVIEPVDLEQRYPEVISAIEHLGEPPATALSLICELLRRHGSAVTKVMGETLERRRPDQYPQDSLPNLYGALRREQSLAPTHSFPSTESTRPTSVKVRLDFDQRHRVLQINDIVEIRGTATYSLLFALAESHLEAAGRGTDPLDYPHVPTGSLAKRFDLANDEAVRRRVLRARSFIRRGFESAELESQIADELIESVQWQGYRLAPDKVEIRMLDQASLIP